MPTTTPDATAADDQQLDDHDLALRLARAAGRELLAVRAAAVEAGEPAAAMKAAGDAAAQRLLSGMLASARPDDAVLSEEAADDGVRLTSSRVWIIDPLDGTREFSEPPRTDWAVHVALWVDGELVAGAVTLPAAAQEYGTAVPPPRPTGVPGRLRLAVSRSRPPAFVQRLAAATDAELVPMGSAGVKATSVLRDEADAYVHAGGQFEWDSAAPVAVAAAAGLHATRIDGSPLRYNQPDPSLPDLLICRPEVADMLLSQIARLSREPSS